MITLSRSGVLLLIGWVLAALSVLNGTILPAVTAAQSVGSVAAGYAHRCALVSGGVKCWGANGFGQLGNGTTTDSLTPVDVVGLTSGVSAVTAGNDASCAVMTSGGVTCWGANSYGQLGDGTTTARSTPVGVVGLASGVSAVTAGNDASCAVMTSGGVMCWGANSYGQLGDGTTTARSTPVAVIGLASGVNIITVGGFHSCAVLITGAVKGWGANSYGQLGDGSTINRVTPVDVGGLASGVSIVTAGNFHSCAVLSAGGVKCWGYDGNGELGNGTTVNHATPVNVSGLPSGASMVTAGYEHSCAITIGGVKCWGWNLYGQLGDGTTMNRLTPVKVIGLSTLTGTPTASPTATPTVTSTPIMPTATATPVPAQHYDLLLPFIQN